MADNPLTITFPIDGSTITEPKGKPFHLGVTGKDTAANQTKITSATLSLNGVDTQISARIAAQPENWLVTFLVKKVGSVKDEYSVQVTDSGGHMATSKFHIQEAEAKPAAGRYNVTPGTGGTVPGSGFTASIPYPGSPLAVSATIGGPTGWRKSGMQIEQQPDEVFYFQNVAPGTGYTITITVYDNPPIYSYANNITVT
jgi:hypothetical protein